MAVYEPVIFSSTAESKADASADLGQQLAAHLGWVGEYNLIPSCHHNKGYVVASSTYSSISIRIKWDNDSDYCSKSFALFQNDNKWCISVPMAKSGSVLIVGGIVVYFKNLEIYSGSTGGSVYKITDRTTGLEVPYLGGQFQGTNAWIDGSVVLYGLVDGSYVPAVGAYYGILPYPIQTVTGILNMGIGQCFKFQRHIFDLSQV